MIAILTGFSIIFSVIAAGYLLARKRIIVGDEQRLVLNRVAFFAATPALMFTVVSESDPSSLFSPVILVSTITAIITAGVFLAITRTKDVMGAMASCYVNSNNIGLPVGIYVLGNAGYVAPLLIVQLVLFTPIVLYFITDSHTQGSRARRILGQLKASLLSPIVVGAVAGLVVCLNGWTPPDIIASPLRILGGASIPMILLSFGASLHKSERLLFDVPTTVATTLKVAGMPVIAWLVGLALGLSGEELYAAVILAALPTAQNVYNYAATFRTGEEIARNTIVASTFLALPAMLLIAAVS